MKKAIMGLLLMGVLGCWAQDTLPEAPKPQKKEEVNPYSGGRILGWKETARKKEFWIPYGALWAASIADAEFTHAGIAHHKCVEGNTLLPRHPSRGQLYREFALENVPITALGYFLRKAGFKWWVIDGPPIYGAVMHAKGAQGWTGEGCW